MKKQLAILILACIIPLTGCGVNQSPSFACVTDRLETPSSPSCQLQAALPASATLATEKAARCCYLDGPIEILTEVFPAASVTEAVAALSGREDLPVLALHPATATQEEYRFSWVAAGEGGNVSCSCVLFFDGAYCYSLLVQCPATQANDYRQEIYNILSTASLEAL